ncbi:MAG: alpha/beta hydrolase [Chloroflexi bacterium]|nr:alpha/beta hydrolase [Chloroflexota bacterium]
MPTTLVILAGLLLLALAVYLYPGPRPPFEHVYARVDPQTVAALRAYRAGHPPRRLRVDGSLWQYFALGQGSEAVLFLHGMGGGGEIWWQQMAALQDRYRVLAVTYPPLGELAALSHGIMAVLEAEGVGKFSVVGSSLGGYLAQFLLSRHPERIRRALLGNTFPPNDVFASRATPVWKLQPLLPEWFLMRFFRGVIAGQLYPASGHSALARATLLEQSYGGMSKAQFVARYRCVLEKFAPPDVQASGAPVMIVEADNDPSVPEVLREKLKETYPSAEVHTLHNVGHFPYLNQPEEYTALIERLLAP